MKRTPQSNLMFATLFLGALLTGCAAMLTQETQYALDTARTRAEHEALASRYEHEAKVAQEKGEEAQKTLEWYKRPGNGNYATVKGGLFNQLTYLVRKYKKAREEDVALAERHRDLAAEAPQ